MIYPIIYTIAKFYCILMTQRFSEKVESDDENALLFQCNVDQIQQWCVDNALSLNIGKCCVITFTRKRNNIKFDYQIGANSLIHSDVVNNLGVSLDSSLSFKNFISTSLIELFPSGVLFREKIANFLILTPLSFSIKL